MTLISPGTFKGETTLNPTTGITASTSSGVILWPLPILRTTPALTVVKFQVSIERGFSPK